MDCQKFTWLWGDFANRMSNLGGQPSSGSAEKYSVLIASRPCQRTHRLAQLERRVACCLHAHASMCAGEQPTIHVAKYDTRYFLSAGIVSD
eukprot:1366005-Rhodomonas_salina.9